MECPLKKPGSLSVGVTSKRTISCGILEPIDFGGSCLNIGIKVRTYLL